MLNFQKRIVLGGSTTWKNNKKKKYVLVIFCIRRQSNLMIFNFFLFDMKVDDTENLVVIGRKSLIEKINCSEEMKIGELFLRAKSLCISCESIEVSPNHFLSTKQSRKNSGFMYIFSWFFFTVVHFGWWVIS